MGWQASGEGGRDSSLESRIGSITCDKRATFTPVAVPLKTCSHCWFPITPLFPVAVVQGVQRLEVKKKEEEEADVEDEEASSSTSSEVRGF